ncbi:hypothetical protein FACS1894181_09620 [Bacteroidia bacterium]|nr:hypothetical protein FACS1894181_09620 [Bacteroidia bacterium]
MKNIYLFLACIAAFMSSCTSQPAHPRIYIADKGKGQFTERLQNVAWAKQSFEKMKAEVEPYVDRHQTDPEWIVSRLQMYWDTHYERIYVKGSAFTHGTGHAPVPTVKFAGHRDGATDYLMPSIEDTQPYMDEKGMYLQNRKKEGQPWEWVHPSKTGRMIGPMNERILKLAANAAFFYWYTKEEKYAVFASDILLTYLKGMHYRREPFALEDYSNSHLMGMATFEVILDHMILHLAVCYDFLYGYLKGQKADFGMIADVFKRLADQQILYGVPDNNWNIFQARHIAYLALALEDDSYYKDRRGRQYYLNEIMNHTTIRQFALKEVIGELFDAETGLWPESATYSMSVCNDMLDIVCLIDNAENNHMLDTFPVLKKAVPATAQYTFPNGRVTAFGDARYVPLSPHPLEMMIALYHKYGDKDREMELTKALQKIINDGDYNRSNNTSMFPLFFYVDKLEEVPPGEASYEHLLKDTYYAPNVSWLMQRNGHGSQNGMAITLTGAFGNHAHANGISLEMYAKGLVLAPESSFGETYGTRDNQEYYARFPAHNTVIVDGISDYGMMRSYSPYELLSCYPAHGGLLSSSEEITFARTKLTEPKTNAEQERLTSIVRTSPADGYVVDIFRSARNDKNDKKHEYFYHSIGQSIALMGRDGQSLLPTAPTGELSSASGDMKGYDYFQNKQAVSFPGDFMARFNIALEEADDVFVNLWMKGSPGRTIFKAEAPKSNAFQKGAIPGELLGKPLPTLIVRQQGEAWNRPFVAVYHPYTAGEGPSVKQVEYFGQASGFVGLAIQSGQRTDYIFNSSSGDAQVPHRDMQFKGVYAIVSEAEGQVEHLFLGEGELLEKGKWSIRAKDGAQVSLSRTDSGMYELITSGTVQVGIPSQAGSQPAVSSLSSPGGKVEGHVVEAGQAYLVDLQEGKYQVKW